MRSAVPGLVASAVIGLASAQDLLPCSNAFYDISQYTCYENGQLCPILNGQATRPCGDNCYLPTMYSCNNGVLAPPAPSANGTFQVISLQTPYYQSAFIEASGLTFRIGGGPPTTYCPDQVMTLGDCPQGKESVWTCGSGYCGLNVEVPGGQQIYVAPNGAVAYTQAPSGVAPPGSQFSGFSFDNGEMQFGNTGFQVCPPADGVSPPQLYVASPQVIEDKDCYDIEVVTASGNEPGFAAWQYT